MRGFSHLWRFRPNARGYSPHVARNNWWYRSSAPSHRPRRPLHSAASLGRPSALARARAHAMGALDGIATVALQRPHGVIAAWLVAAAIGARRIGGGHAAGEPDSSAFGRTAKRKRGLCSIDPVRSSEIFATPGHQGSLGDHVFGAVQAPQTQHMMILRRTRIFSVVASFGHVSPTLGKSGRVPQSCGERLSTDIRGGTLGVNCRTWLRCRVRLGGGQHAVAYRCAIAATLI